MTHWIGLTSYRAHEIVWFNFERVDLFHARVGADRKGSMIRMGTEVTHVSESVEEILAYVDAEGSSHVRE